MRRLTRTLIWVLCFGALIVSTQLSSFLSADSGDVTELAPGVFFREQTEGCNNGWIVFKDYVLVVDANFPEHAAKEVEAIKKTTDKPSKFVLDTP